MARILDAVALRITSAVGTVYCALIFAAIAVIATPGLFPQAVTAVATWVAQAFLQLVLLSVIMVGQRLQSAATETLIRETHDAVLEELAAIRALTDGDRKLTPKEAAALIHAVCARTPEGGRSRSRYDPAYNMHRRRLRPPRLRPRNVQHALPARQAPRRIAHH